jgi:hypothetical protein
VAVYRRLILASLAPDGPLFEDYGPVCKYVNGWFNRSLGTISVLATAHKYLYPGNWKW